MSVSASIQLESVSTRIVDELEPGDGASFPKVGDKLLVHYTGCLAATGRCFDSSRARGHAFTFTVGCGKVIKGWDVLLLRLCKGQRVKLHVGAVDGYGAAGSPPNVPANADLLFDVQLIDINEPLVKEGIRYRKELEDKARREVEEQQERDAKAAMASEGPKAAASGPKRPRESDESGSGSDSDSSSSSSESSGAARKRKERKKDKKKEKREKKRRERKEAKKSSKKEAKRGRKKEKKKKRDRETVQRSVITGKRLKLDDSAADTEGRARRAALLAHMNEGEGEAYGVAAHAPVPPRPDTAQMRDLMHAADAARREKRQRLGALVRGGGDDFAGSIAREYATQRSSGGGKRDVRDAADYMKKDSNF